MWKHYAQQFPGAMMLVREGRSFQKVQIFMREAAQTRPTPKGATTPARGRGPQRKETLFSSHRGRPGVESNCWFDA